MKDEFDDDEIEEEDKEVYEIIRVDKNDCGCNDKECEDEDRDCKDKKCECNHNGFEEVEVDVLEFGLDDLDIEDLIAKLLELRETKQQVEFDLDDENKFVINYIEDDEEIEEDEFDDDEDDDLEEMGDEDEWRNWR